MRRLAMIGAFVLGAAACTGGIEGSTSALDSPRASRTPSPSTTPSAADRRIVVRAPRPRDDIFSPVVVTGTASSASGEVMVRVLGEDGTELAAIEAPIGCGTRCSGTFRARLVFFAASRQDGVVQVLDVGPDETVRRLVEVPVTVVPGV